MKRFYSCLFAMLFLYGFAKAQDSQSNSERLLQRIHEAEETSASTLDLSYSDVTELPPEIGNLSNLIYLNLSFSNLGSLPPEIGNLTNLLYLDLSFNQLTTLPSEIGNLSNLLQLNLNRNHLTALPDTIGQLSNLQELDLIGSRLSTLPSTIGQLTNLQWLSLGENELTSLPDEIGSLHNLCFLDLSDNQLEYLPTSLSNLTALDTSDCLVGGEVAIAAGLSVDDNPLVSPPIEVAARGIAAIFEYLRNETWLELQKLLITISSFTGPIALVLWFITWWRTKRRGKQKNETVSA